MPWLENALPPNILSLALSFYDNCSSSRADATCRLATVIGLEYHHIRIFKCWYGSSASGLQAFGCQLWPQCWLIAQHYLSKTHTGVAFIQVLVCAHRQAGLQQGASLPRGGSDYGAIHSQCDSGGFVVVPWSLTITKRHVTNWKCAGVGSLLLLEFNISFGPSASVRSKGRGSVEVFSWRAPFRS